MGGIKRKVVVKPAAPAAESAAAPPKHAIQSPAAPSAPASAALLEFEAAGVSCLASATAAFTRNRVYAPDVMTDEEKASWNRVMVDATNDRLRLMRLLDDGASPDLFAKEM